MVLFAGEYPKWDSLKEKRLKSLKMLRFRGPFEFKILDYNISLRKSEAELIEVVPTRRVYSINKWKI